ncbi:MAG: PH domain-containing protein [Candidatus Kerfeldbacteria bacterium]|nr:PH domain-containing protein [Candidatus Kerfeldbacteria bacterium]
MPITAPPAFAGQQPNEKTLMIMHRHWLVFLRTLANFVLLGLVPGAIVVFLILTYHWSLASGSFSFTLLSMAAVIYYLFWWILLYGFWLDYSLDMFVITDQRVIDIEQTGLFDRTTAELDLSRVQDVTSEVKGFFPTMFHYGNVYIQTAGEKERFIFEQVPNPDQVVKTILSLTNLVEKKQTPALNPVPKQNPPVKS